MKILFAFENCLPSTEADAEVFVTTARYLAPRLTQSWLHVPLQAHAPPAIAGLRLIRAVAPLHPAALRHFCCGLTLPFRAETRTADLIYTRNLWVAWMAVLCRRRVAFDHYRPWPDQIPPLQPILYRLMSNRYFLVNICHSDYTLNKYRALGIDVRKLVRVHNGYEPRRLQSPLSATQARHQTGLPEYRQTVVYTGRLNHKKGLDLVIAAAARLPDLLFVLVGSHGAGPIEAMAAALPNIRIVGWQPPEALGAYIQAADILLIPPSTKPLAEFGSTVLPLKLFLYMASGRPILAGDTADIKEMLRHDENAHLCHADSLDALVDGLLALIKNPARASRLAAAALAESADYTWDARAHRIVDILTANLHLPPQPKANPVAQRSRAWARSSWRWLLHLARTGSWVLPPEMPFHG